MSEKLRQIAVSQENYLALKRLGSAGDSFNDVLTEVLKKVIQQQNDAGVGRPNHSAASESINLTDTQILRSGYA